MIIGVDTWCKLAAEERLTKIALNALDARNMAKSVGLQPAGNWKWALRSLRDGRGNVLQGKELATAKEGLGKMPNNLRQTLNSSSRQMGGRTEIATHADKVEGKLLYTKKAPSLKEPNYYDYSPLPKPPGSSINKHPFKNDFYTDGISVGGEFKGYPYVVQDGGEHHIRVHTHAFKNNDINNKRPEFKRAGHKDWRITTPSGSLNFAQELSEKRRNNITKLRENKLNGGEGVSRTDNGIPDWSGLPSSTTGDMSGITRNYPELTHEVIYDPIHGNEGVHKMRPQGLRSIYFKNQGLYN